MGNLKSPPKPPSRTDVRFDFVDQLPANVPPVEQQPTSLFPFPPPVGPAKATYYFPIALDGCNPTGVFFPSGFSFSSQINVLLYFHGHKLGEFKTINQYWSGKLHNIRLREDVNAADKQLVLIAPTMGENPGSSLNADMGIFRQPGGGDEFLSHVVRWIGKYVPQYVEKKLTPTVGNVVLAGHSGAGGILSQQAKTMQSKVCEVWGFDSMYGEGWLDKAHKQAIDVPGNWLDTAAAHHKLEFDNFGIIPIPRLRPMTMFYFYWAGTGPGANARDLQDRVRNMGLSNVIVEPNSHVGGAYHFETLTANFRRRVVAASCF
jgi:hypothetical protein